MLIGRTTNIPNLIGRLTDFRLKGQIFSWKYRPRWEKELTEDLWQIPQEKINKAKTKADGLCSPDKLILLQLGFEIIEAKMREEGILDSDSAGATHYDIETFTDTKQSSGVRYIPTPFNAGIYAFRFVRTKIPINENNRIAHLGSGLGLPDSQSKLFGFESTGFELNQDLCQSANQIPSKFLALPELNGVEIRQQSFYDSSANLGNFGYIYFYLNDNAATNPALVELLSDTLKPNTIIIAHGQQVEHPPAIKFEHIPTNEQRVNIYRIKS